MTVTRLIRRVRFAAAHRYRRPEWSEEQNVKVFGLCARPNYHGHTYTCTVTVEGPVDPLTGMVIDLAVLDRVLAAEVVSRFDHRNINLDVPEFAEGKLVPTGENLARFVMERVQGQTLRAAMHRHQPMSVAVATEWFEPILNGIAAAHVRGIVHRDLKPENVMGHRDVSGALAVKILDLGLVKLRAEEQQQSGTMTADGVIMGTPDYMAPEQLLGQAVDARTDIFAIGVMLLEALTGARTTRGTDLPTFLAPELRQLLRRCLAADPTDRPPSAQQLHAELAAILRS